MAKFAPEHSGRCAPPASRRRLSVLSAGASWCVLAYAVYYTRCPLHLLGSWPWFGEPAWLGFLRHAWRGFPIEVGLQGALFAWIAGVVVALGHALFRRIDARATPGEALVFGPALILAGLGLLVFGIGMAGLLQHAGVVLPALLVAGTISAVWLHRPGASARESERFGKPFALRADLAAVLRPRGAGETAVLILLVGLHGLALLYALTPAVQSDALRYHLAAPQEWLKAGRITYLPYNAHSNFPFLVDMLFLYGLGIRGDLLAKTMHFFFLPLGVGMVGLLSRRCLQVAEFEEAEGCPRDPRLFGIRLPWLAALAWGVSPLALPLAGWGFIDLGVLAFTLGMLYYVIRFLQTRFPRYRVLAAVFGGCLFASKYTGLPYLAMAAAVLGAAEMSGRPRREWGRVALGAVLFVLIGVFVASPWLVRNLANTGNPVYPLAWEILGGGEWNAESESLYAMKLAEKGRPLGPDNRPCDPPVVRELLRLPWSTAVDPLRFGSFEIGPFYWVFTPWLLVWAGRALRRRRPGGLALVALCALWLGFWFFTYRANRFLMPLLAVGAAAAPASLVAATRDVRRIWPGAFLLIALAAPIMHNAIDSTRWFLFSSSAGPWPACSLGFLTRDEYLTLRLDYYPFARYCSTRLAPDDRVLLVGEHRKFHWRCAVEGNDWFDAPRIRSFLREGLSGDEVLTALRAEGFTHIFFNLDEWGWPEKAALQVGSESTPIPVGSAWYYNRRFFSREDIVKIWQILASPRLERVMKAPGPRRAFLARITEKAA